jgi:hypothetical protein
MIFEIKLKQAMKIGTSVRDRLIISDPLLGKLKFTQDIFGVIISGGILTDYDIEIPYSNIDYLKKSHREQEIKQPVLIEDSTEPVSKAAPKKKK